ncbi:MAG: hypothetical protein JJU36_11815 [Phycisphaeraceae bacterium]|nr:hypothetical protein [Phycisphaeraceae bacterium]
MTNLAPLLALAALLLLTPWQSMATASADADPNATVVTLELADFLDEGRPLVVHMLMPTGDRPAAFALSPGFNAACHTVAFEQPPVVTAQRIDCGLRVTILPDPWVPRDGKPMDATVHVRTTVSQGRIEGRYEGKLGDREVRGTVSGQVGSAPETSRANGLLMLQMLELPLEGIDKPWQRRAVVELSLRDGQVTGGAAYTLGSPTYGEWSGYLEEPDLRLTQGRLRGRVTLNYHGGRQERKSVRLEIDALVIGDHVGGRYQAPEGTADPKTPRLITGQFTASKDDVRRPPFPMVLNLHDLLGDGGHTLRLHLASDARGKIQGFGFSPTFNRATHWLDDASLEIEDGHLRGRLRITAHTDSFQPGHPATWPLDVTIDVKLDGRHGVGAHHGTLAGRPARGIVDARMVDPHTPADPQPLAIKLEDGLIGGAAWQNRAFLTFTIKDGQVVPGRFFSNKDVWQGSLEGGTARFVGDRIEAELRARVEDGTVESGRYDIRIDGAMVGGVLGGQFEVKHESGRERTGQFVGSLGTRPPE